MRNFIGMTLALSLLGAAPAIAADAMDIVKKANHASYYVGDDGRAKVAMAITDDQGRAREREFVILRKDEDETDGPQNFYVYFNKPADVKKMVFMVHKNVDRDDDRWLYLPALDLVKRIAASDERTSFVGSHFYYEDVSGRGINEDLHELIEENDATYVIRSTPKDKDAVEFAFYKNWIHKGTSLPIKTEYYDVNGNVLRSYAALKVDLVDGHPTVTAAEMKDHQSGGKTVMTYSDVKYDVGLPEDIFTERYLRKAPRKYLR
ncbi:outer membrane lipoprotein-sorting protein [Paremcibacter congregatus]|uniref:Outer membrane lipoprotein-sorting protein n=1 Tax=Paremcibacter congregatus TaxID=2043170 RepID=A0A2G4YMB4_9PROT|nr:outer membrane lipoprotein-sorting protein [Paremcibacter congregatus]PHZ83451.1 outer membrane lipoprotein-sorting protein [Paremcibacter congregatus]QDE28082.1 outer membrane lipoprotein-sorting protein [Paremcibacter congregatus]